MKNTFTVTMTSAEFGTEEFPRETLAEAIATVTNLKKKARKLKDGIKRTYDIVIGQEPAPVDNIFRANVTTSGGNTLQFFYNPNNNLVVVDIVAANEKGGNEIVRKTLDEKILLAHTR